MSTILRGREFTPKEIKTIQKLVQQYYEQGRTRISVEVCNALDWRQSNGWLKDRACRDVLRSLEEASYFTLPHPKHQNNNVTRSFHVRPPTVCPSQQPITRIDFADVRFRELRGDREEQLWNGLVHEYHYLGFKVFVGRYLKYLIYFQDIPVAAFGVCDPAWSVASRDEVLREAGLGLHEIRQKCVNNARFLILPWVKVPNFASWLLSRLAKLVQTDWANYYSTDLIMIETFVDTKLFAGTCYRAANWHLLGQTRGFLKSGSKHSNHQTRKLLFVYPLTKRLQRQLIHRQDGLNDALSHM